MRSLLLSALAATAVIAATSVGLATDASAATRRPHHHARVVPDVRQDPSGAFNQFSAPVLPDPALSYRWPPSGGAT
jgi:hypothetical protein